MPPFAQATALARTQSLRLRGWKAEICAELFELAPEAVGVAMRRGAQLDGAVRTGNPDALVRGGEGDERAGEEEEAPQVDDGRRRVARDLQAGGVRGPQAGEVEREAIVAVARVESGRFREDPEAAGAAVFGARDVQRGALPGEVFGGLERLVREAVGGLQLLAAAQPQLLALAAGFVEHREARAHAVVGLLVAGLVERDAGVPKRRVHRDGLLRQLAAVVIQDAQVRLVRLRTPRLELLQPEVVAADHEAELALDLGAVGRADHHRVDVFALTDEDHSLEGGEPADDAAAQDDEQGNVDHPHAEPRVAPLLGEQAVLALLDAIAALRERIRD